MTNQDSQVQSASAATARVKVPRTGIVAVMIHSSVGRKMMVAVTGIILMLFVLGHLLGNLQIFLGPTGLTLTRNTWSISGRSSG